MSATKRLVYCHCAYAKVVPKKVKEEVLRRLGASERDFEAVPDLCEMAARKDALLAEYAAEPGLEIVACFPRAVGWLFHGAGHALPETAKVHNMREASADEIVDAVEYGVAPDSSASAAETDESGATPYSTASESSEARS